MPALSQDEVVVVDRAHRWLRSVQRATTDALSLETLRTLLIVALNPGITVIEVAERMGKSRGLASRQLLDLGIKRRRQSSGPDSRGEEAGYGLVEPFFDPRDLRLRRYRCTAKGNAVVRRLARIVRAEGRSDDGDGAEVNASIGAFAPGIAC